MQGLPLLALIRFSSSSCSPHHLGRDAGAGGPVVEGGAEAGLGGGGEEGDAGGDAGGGVEVDARPDEEGVAEVEDEEGRRGEGEGQLRGEEGEEVVVALARERGLRGWVEEEGAEVSAEVWARRWLAVGHPEVEVGGGGGGGCFGLRWWDTQDRGNIQGKGEENQNRSKVRKGKGGTYSSPQSE